MGDGAPSLRRSTRLVGFRSPYSGSGFAELEGNVLKVQRHADHTWERMPWHGRLVDDGGRGLGAEFRILGLDPDRLEKKAREMGVSVMLGATDFPGHGWRECYLEDPDGYLWVAGRLLRSEADQVNGG